MEMQKLIREYGRAIRELEALPEPEVGDCMDCFLRDADTNVPIGDDRRDHLEAHLRERYIHGSLIYNAIMWDGHTDPWLAYCMDLREAIISAVKRYFRAKLGLVR